MEHAHEPRPRETADTLAARLDRQQEKLMQLKRAIAETAIYSTLERDRLEMAARGVSDAASDVIKAVSEHAIEERFGDEESYWTTYRMFTAENNRGRLWSIDETWEYLGKNYDMTDETAESLEATLLEWTDDFEEDAKTRGIRGKFMAFAGGFMFAEAAGSVKRRASIRVEPTVAEIEIPAHEEPEIELSFATEAHETVTQLEGLIGHITWILADEPGKTLKQAVIKKRIAGTYLADGNLIQGRLNAAVRAGELYKFRRDKVAYLSLDPHEDDEPVADDTPEEKKPRTFDIPLSISVLQTLTAPGTHFNQKLTLSELWRRIDDSPSKSQAVGEADLERLKKVCRDLQTAGLVTAGGEKMGTGGVRTNSATSSKRRRSATRQVFKVGLTSQEQKVEIQQLLDYSDIDSLVQQRLLTALE